MAKFADYIHNRINKLYSTGFFHVFGGNVINKIIGFASGVLLVRILTKVEYGVFTYAWNIYSLIIIFSGMGMDSSLLQFSSEKGGDYEYTQKVSNYCTKIGLVFNLFLSLILIFTGLFIPLKIQAGGKILCALCLLPCLQILFSMMSCFLRGMKKNQEYAKLSVINTVLVFVFSAIGSYVFREMGMVIGQYLSYIITCIYGYFVLNIRLIGNDKSVLSDEKINILKIGIISMLSNGVSQLMMLLDIFVIGLIDPNETILASYKVATIIPTALSFIPTSFIVYLYPLFAEHKDDREWCLDHYKRVTVGIGVFNALLSLFLIITAKYFIGFIFGQQYLDAIPVFRILSINYFLSGTFRIIAGNLLVTQRKLIFNLIESFITCLINIIADYFFILKMGSIGAAFATVLMVTVSSIMSTIYLVYTFKNIKNQ